MKEYDIKIAVHNHGRTDKNFPTPESVLALVHDMDPRLLDLHIKDESDLSRAETQAPIGEGKMPIAAIFRELMKMNYRGGVMLESAGRHARLRAGWTETDQ